ncbi:MAG TPA: ATP synthase F1 subunit delta [Phnomibacter sp.]|nr:ATP synthase F1 subunit delta [Phnomibacter sp.]
MQNPRLAGRYAKSLMDIALENNQLEPIKEDIGLLHKCVNSSAELRGLLRSPIIQPAKKQSILNALFAGKIGPVTAAFIKLLVAKGREKVLPEILDAFKEQYNKIKGIHQVKVTTAQPMSESLKNSLLQKFKQDAGIEHVELTTEVREELLGGFVLEYDNKLIDASLQRDLKDIKRQFYRNDYLYNIR